VEPYVGFYHITIGGQMLPPRVGINQSFSKQQLNQNHDPTGRQMKSRKMSAEKKTAATSKAKGKESSKSTRQLSDKKTL
jgi:hypothetical protein